MPCSSLLNNNPRINALGATLLVLALAGCAQQQTPGYYDVQRDTTSADARQQAQGRNSAQAPSQIQLGFGDNQPARPIGQEVQEAEPVIKARPLAEARTFLGTVPCLSNDGNCSATRITLTLAPSGEWRSRTVFLDAPGQNNITQQGCWDVIGTRPLRIMLTTGKQAGMANLTFVNDNVLRINMINDMRPTLEHHLTRQADVDGIDEISNKTPLQCD
ncbi:copper resistance protein NlpE [Pusillimonas sp. MFBS29]|uniref:copper resistance protein NlpE N-terminal domain-containing protein n=1 Tax=Pusillimonas sp. MFBS29 TaxID=2886690 RepID=UPI001D10D06F|nr:copper resistance protein NlpE N-terminal domain-containing protein [Pusillimonas sp. MFBS29]MCC2597608.1 copper resistance protein NlpE [Pusillimonas sp. MFBS29]